MAAPDSLLRLKTAGDLQIWLAEMGNRAVSSTELMAHGGTALTLLGLKVSTKDVVFLFKTYPLRDSDLDDLRGIVDRSALDQVRIVDLFDEQDRLWRQELERSDLEYEPLIDLLNLRTRFAGSFQLIGAAYRKKL